MQKKITYKNLSGALKFSVIVSYIIGIYFILMFLIGFIAGVITALI